MDLGPQVPPDVVDAAVLVALDAVGALPGVHRVGMALVEGAGRRLQFTSSDRTDETVEWCHIDAFDDVPLTAVVRTGETVAATLGQLEARFPAFAGNQDSTRTTAVVAVPLLDAGRPIGGIVAFVRGTESVLRRLTDRITSIAATAAAAVAAAALHEDASPPPQGASFTVAAAEEVGPARRHVRDLLHSQDVGDETLDDAVLCLSEVLTNVIMHTSSPAEVEVHRRDDVLRLVVRDRGSSRGAVPTVADTSDPLRVHGRGLQLLDALSARWSADPAEDGTVVWFEFDLPA